MRKLMLPILCSIVVIMCGCSNDNPVSTDTTGNITGTITRAADGYVISGVTLITNPSTGSSVTDENGKYNFQDIEPGTYTVIASKSGYFLNSVNISVIAGKTTVANIALSDSSGEGMPPATPLLIFPADDSVNVLTGIAFRWSSVSLATGYNIQVSTDSLFATLIINSQTLDNSYLTIDSLSHGTTYYWRVNAYNMYGISNWSAVWSFMTTSSSVLTGTGELAVSGSDNRDSYSFVSDSINYGKITLVWYSSSVVTFEANGIIVGTGDVAPDSGYSTSATVSVGQSYFIKTDNAVHYAKISVTTVAYNSSTDYWTVGFQWILQSEANSRNLY